MCWEFMNVVLGHFLAMKRLKVDKFMVLDVLEWPDPCLGVIILRV